MNTKCDADEIRYQLLLKFYELAKEPEKWSRPTVTKHYEYSPGTYEAPADYLMCGSVRVFDGGWSTRVTRSGGTVINEYQPRYTLEVSNRIIRKSDYTLVEVEPERWVEEPAKLNWLGVELKPHSKKLIPAVTEQIPDEFHQTCASLFAAWSDIQECQQLQEALQSLSPKTSPKPPKAKSVKPPVKVEATPAKAPRAEQPRKAPLASAAVTKRK